MSSAIFDWWGYIHFVHSFVTFKLDNLVALLYVILDTKINKLHWIQEHVAKLVPRKKKHDHVTPIFASLHWFPLQFRIRYKILLLTYKCLHGEAPQYLLSLLQKYTPPRTLQSLEQLILCKTKAYFKSYGDLTLSVAAPCPRNALPIAIGNCDTEHAFNQALKHSCLRRNDDV